MRNIKHSSTVRRHNFLGLDGLRGIAAIAVLIAHASAIILGHALLARKYMAVQFFFMLSGFVVTCAYEERLKTDMTFSQFALRRMIRLYPLMIVAALLGWLFFANFEPKFSTDPNNMHAVAFSALGLPYSGSGFNFGYFPVNPPGWSLFFELLAYCLFGLLIRWTASALLAIAAIVGLCLYGYSAVLYQGHDLPFWMNVFGAGASFSIGMLLWRCYKSKLWIGKAVSFPLLAAVMLLVCAIPDSTSLLVNPVFVAVVFPAVIITGANDTDVRFRLALEFLGELSYPLYILHWPIVLLTRHFLLDEIGPEATVAASCVFAIVVSWVIYQVFDKPFRAYLNVRFFPSSPERFVQSS
jgi:peptidoglycan/LPS O-acetylase OafA/YrhL